MRIQCPRRDVAQVASEESSHELTAKGAVEPPSSAAHGPMFNGRSIAWPETLTLALHGCLVSKTPFVPMYVAPKAHAGGC